MTLALGKRTSVFPLSRFSTMEVVHDVPNPEWEKIFACMWTLCPVDAHELWPGQNLNFCSRTPGDQQDCNGQFTFSVDRKRPQNSARVPSPRDINFLKELALNTIRLQMRRCCTLYCFTWRDISLICTGNKGRQGVRHLCGTGRDRSTDNPRTSN